MVLTILFMMTLVIVDRDVRCSQRPLFVFIMALTSAGAAGFLGGSATASGKVPFFKDSPLAIAASGAGATLVIVLVLGFKLYASVNCTDASAAPAPPPPSPSPPPSVSVSPPAIISRLPTAEQLVVQAASKAIFQASQALPVIVRDDFANNDYRWPIGESIYNGGIRCITTIEGSAFKISVFSAAGPAYCFGGLEKTARDFNLSADLRLSRDVTADVEIRYRVVDNDNYHSVKYNPRTQTLSSSSTVKGQSRSIIEPTYVSDISQSETNHINLLVVGKSHVIYFNEKLSVIFEDANVGQGQVRFAVTVQEAHKQATLSIGRLVIRGK